MPQVTVSILIVTECSYNHLGDEPLGMPLGNVLDYIHRSVEPHQLYVALLPGQEPRL